MIHLCTLFFKVFIFESKVLKALYKLQNYFLSRKVRQGSKIIAFLAFFMHKFLTPSSSLTGRHIYLPKKKARDYNLLTRNYILY